MELQQFLSANNVTEIGLYKSTKSNRFVGSLMLGGHNIKVMTTEKFNKDSDTYVYAGEIDSTVEEVDADGNKSYVPTGEKEPCFIFSNNAGKAPDLLFKKA